jgi:TonB family protein
MSGKMKRAFVISIAAHLVILLGFWQVSQTLSKPVARGYPRMITATLVAKPAAAVQTLPSPEPPAAAAAPAPTPVPVSKTKKPVPDVPIKKPQKTPPAIKPNAPSSTNSSGSSGVSGKSSGGVPGGNTLKIDGPEFPFPHYLMLVQNRIEINWQAPGGQGQRMATVYFKITPSGEIAEVKLEQSSGNFVFDQAATRAIYSANPLPPLPVGAGMQTLGVHFDFVAY